MKIKLLAQPDSSWGLYNSVCWVAARYGWGPTIAEEDGVPNLIGWEIFKKYEKFENVNAGMAHENEKSETDLAWISGYVPTANIEEFSAKCKENQWAFAISDPEDDDIEVPTKIPMPRPVDSIFEDWEGPKRDEFKKKILMKSLTGNQKWQLYCLEQFLVQNNPYINSPLIQPFRKPA